MKKISLILFSVLLTAYIAKAADDHIVYEGKAGPGKGKHIVFLTGDEEYRGEEGLPMMAKILSQRHGFKCTVLFSLNDKGEIDPNNQKSLSHPQALDSADVIIMLLRFRTWPDEMYKHFDDACNRGIPVLGLRTSTHAFRGKLGGFGKRVLGERWVSHWGHHKREACRGVVEPSAKGDSILNGVVDVFADSDVYEAYPPKDAKILMRGLVLENMKPDSKPSTRERKKGRGINDPAMAVAWTRKHKWPSGKTSNIFTTTMGAATDLQSEGLRRMIINAVYDGLGIEVPKKADVDYLDPYKPLFYGFNSFRKGIKPADHALGKVLPAGKKK
ncbi:uncharacterized protein METZ01_LOCUS226509 [marine metagenome]|uniref:ThuA-like domain-containing protein n=1 Tax=marine metagenome TaxID=408172 RepID=A0A382GFZ5_9ZZZZ